MQQGMASPSAAAHSTQPTTHLSPIVTHLYFVLSCYYCCCCHDEKLVVAVSFPHATSGGYLWPNSSSYMELWMGLYNKERDWCGDTIPLCCVCLLCVCGSHGHCATQHQWCGVAVWHWGASEKPYSWLSSLSSTSSSSPWPKPQSIAAIILSRAPKTGKADRAGISFLACCVTRERGSRLLSQFSFVPGYGFAWLNSDIYIYTWWPRSTEFFQFSSCSYVPTFSWIFVLEQLLNCVCLSRFPFS